MATSAQENGRERESGRAPVVVAMRKAADQLAELLGIAPDTVSAVEPRGDGWLAKVEVVEVERVPDTTSVMATYRVELDARGDLVGYERTHRYVRGRTDGR
ncbi:gas vesicle protein GvpO [Streptomyces sp. JJ36]|uniref:gas vesicle protein GvpO n=1 Tax=Streptomyces sp. JJ36 TaxID=2736645 RepID=UPI001F225870|nr:gas vesicle protein GvpO [Streptomyces sp. JJ36]MCF6523611.1 gas vesicle protein [Streptomyces sp. JJ36]